MSAVGVRELKQNTSEIIRRVREKGEEIEVTYHGEVVARLVPVKRRKPNKKDAAIWVELDQIADEIGRSWPEGVSAVDAVRDVRR
jgi:prevent-host-death family protein